MRSLNDRQRQALEDVASGGSAGVPVSTLAKWWSPATAGTTVNALARRALVSIDQAPAGHDIVKVTPRGRRAAERSGNRSEPLHLAPSLDPSPLQASDPPDRGDQSFWPGRCAPGGLERVRTPSAQQEEDA